MGCGGGRGWVGVVDEGVMERSWVWGWEGGRKNGIAQGSGIWRDCLGRYSSNIGRWLLIGDSFKRALWWWMELLLRGRRSSQGGPKKTREALYDMIRFALLSLLLAWRGGRCS